MVGIWFSRQVCDSSDGFYSVTVGIVVRQIRKCWKDKDRVFSASDWECFIRKNVQKRTEITHIQTFGRTLLSLLPIIISLCFYCPPTSPSCWALHLAFSLYWAWYVILTVHLYALYISYKNKETKKKKRKYSVALMDICVDHILFRLVIDSWFRCVRAMETVAWYKYRVPGLDLIQYVCV